MKARRLTLKELRRLVWLTWFELVIVGVVVYFFSDPFIIPVVLASPIAVHAMVNFWVKSHGIPVKIYSVVPTVFLPTAFLTGVGALISAIVHDKVINSCTLAFATVCVLCIMLVYPESKYADYEWISLRMKIRCIIMWRISLKVKTFYKYNSS